MDDTLGHAAGSADPRGPEDGPGREPGFHPEAWLLDHRSLRRMAHALVGQACDGDDVVQGAYLEALGRPARSVGRGWLRQVVRSRGIDALRRRRTREEHRERLAAESHTPSAPGASEIAERLECHRVLSEAVARLAEPYRSAVYLRYFEELTPVEIARRAAVPVKTVKTRLYRGLALLRERLSGRLGRGEDGWRAVLATTLSLEKAAVATELVALGGLGIMSKKLIAAGLVGAALLGVARLGPWSGEAAYPEGALAAGAPEAELVLPLAGGSAPQVPAVDGERASVDVEEVPAAPAAAGARTGALRVRARWADGTVAPGVQVDVHLGVRGRPRTGLARAVTGADGAALFEGLEPAELRVGASRSGWEGQQACTVTAGETTAIDLVVPAGLDVEGVVLADGGRPVAGVRIWVSSGRTNWMAGETAAVSDDAGRFRVTQVAEGASLGALAPGYAPSPLVDLDLADTSATPVVIELRLAAPGGAVTGRVSDAAGAPLAGAWVAVGAPVSRFKYRMSADGFEEVWAPRAVQTDAAGVYLVESLEPGEHPVAVRGAEHAVWKGSVAVRASDTTVLDVALQRGFGVEGIVVDAAGDPLPGAVVRAFDERIELTFVQSGQFDYVGTFDYATASADEDGRYALHHLPVGEADLHATPPTRKEDSYKGVRTMRAHARIVGAEGERHEWNPTIDEGHVIAGRVEYRDGVPMPNVFVSAREVDAKGDAHQALVADGEGRFRFLNMQPVPHVIGVQLWDAPEGAAPVEAHGVWPDREELVLRADFDAPVEMEPATLVVRVEDAGRRVPVAGNLNVQLQLDTGSWKHSERQEDGSFRFERIQVSRVRPHVLSGEDPVHVGDWVELQPGEHRDIGTLVTRPGGALTIEFVRDESTLHVEPKLWLRPGDALFARQVEVGAAETVRVENMSFGSYTYSGYAKGMATLEGAFELPEGGDGRLVLTLRGATQQPIEVDWADGEALGNLRVRVVDAEGKECWDSTETNILFLARPYTRSPRLPLGRYTVTVDTLSGLKGSAEFEIAQLTETPDPIRIDLR